MPFIHPVTGEPYSIVNLFAGSGSISQALKAVYGVDPDLAVNHCPDAIGLHRANFKRCKTLQESIYKTDPQIAMAGMPRIWHLHLSADCTTYSSANGGRPVNRSKRFLADIVFHWIDRLRKTGQDPIVISFENVVQFRHSGPLLHRRIYSDGTPVSLDHIWDNHELTGEPLYFHHGKPEYDQSGRAVEIPDPRQLGKYYHRYIYKLRRRGYKVEDTDLRACDYGDATIRTRMALVAILKGKKIPWPAPTHGDPNSEEVKSGRLLPWRTAADVIDFGKAALSLFATPEETARWNKATGQNCRRPLVFNTEARVARGYKRYVLDCEEPYIVESPSRRKAGGQLYASDKLMPFIVRQNTGMDARDVRLPVPTLTVRGSTVQAAAVHLSIFKGRSVGSDARQPVRTIETKNSHAIAAHYLVKLRGTCKDGQAIDRPLPTITAGGNHVGKVSPSLVPLTGTAGHENRIEQVRDFLNRYFGPGAKFEGELTEEQMLGIVEVRGEKYQVTDMSLRMLSPREAIRSHSLDDSFEIERRADGKKLPVAKQMEKCGNGVAVAAFTALFRSINEYALSELKVAA